MLSARGRREMKKGFGVITMGALLALSGASACVFTGAGTKPQPTEPATPTFRPRVEHAVGDFGFAWGEGELTMSTIDGGLLSNEIMDAWKQRGYAADGRFVESKEFSGKADYNLTLTGSQRNTASLFLEALNAFTLTLFPYTVTQRYELTYVLEDVANGKTYRAAVQGWDVTYVGVLVLPAFPFAHRGHAATMMQMADSLYEQFRRQGAFKYPCPPCAGGIAMRAQTAGKVDP